MKKLLLATALLAAPTLVQAKTFGQGFYLGLGLGGTNASGSLKYDQDSAVTTDQVHDTRLGNTSFAGDLVAGYSKRFDNRFLLRGELGYLFDSLDSKHVLAKVPASQDNVRVKSTGAFNANVAVGYAVQEKALVWLGVGADWRRFKADGANSGAVATQVSVSSSKVGFAPEVGFELGLNDNWSLTGRYRKTFFGQVSKVDTKTGGEKPEIKASPTVDNFMLTARYRFN